MVSPDGRYEVTFYDREVFNTHWVETPTLVDKQTGETLLTFKDTQWSVDEREWTGDASLRFHMRKYPGNHQPGELVVTLDCATRSATLADLTCGFDELEQRMDASLTWIYAKPDTREPLPGILGALRRLFKGY